MQVLVVGGGKVGYFLCKSLLNNGYDVKIIEKNRDICKKFADELDVPVFWGDGTDLDLLQAAGIASADAFVAVTGKDEINLISCQLARMKYRVPKTVARVNNPQNVEVMSRLGVDFPVSSTGLIAGLIEHEVDSSGAKVLASIHGMGAILQVHVPEHARVSGMMVRDIDMPKECIIVSVTRNHEFFIPRGDSVIRAGDEVLAVCIDKSRRRLYKVLTREE